MCGDEWYEVQQSQVLVPTLGSQHPQAVPQAGGREAGKLLVGKGPGCAGNSS